MSATAAPAALPDIGAPAPDFTLPSTAGGKVALSALRGGTVLIAFFPLAFSSTCTEELCEMRDDYDAFSGRGVTVLPISVDHTYSLIAYRDAHGMRTQLLSDFHREVSRRYGVYVEARGHSGRAYFLVDADGVLRWRHVEDNPSFKRTNAELLQAIDDLG